MEALAVSREYFKHAVVEFFLLNQIEFFFTESKLVENSEMMSPFATAAISFFSKHNKTS